MAAVVVVLLTWGLIPQGSDPAPETRDPLAPPSDRGGRALAAAGDRVGAHRLRAARPADRGARPALPSERRSGPIRGTAPGLDRVARRPTRERWRASRSGSTSRRRRRRPEGPRGSRLLLVLDEVEDPQNLGAVIRVAEGVGARGRRPRARLGAPVGCRLPQLGRGRRAGPHRPDEEPSSISGSDLKEDGFRVVGLEPTGSDLYGVDLTGRPGPRPRGGGAAGCGGSSGRGVTSGAAPDAGSAGFLERVDRGRRRGLRGGPAAGFSFGTD